MRSKDYFVIVIVPSYGWNWTGTTVLTWNLEQQTSTILFNLCNSKSTDEYKRVV